MQRPAARRRPEPGASAARRSRAWSGTRRPQARQLCPAEPDPRPNPSADTAGRQRAGCPGGWLSIGLPPPPDQVRAQAPAVVLLAQLTAILPGHTDRMAALPRVKPEGKP